MITLRSIVAWIIFVRVASSTNADHVRPGRMFSKFPPLRLSKEASTIETQEDWELAILPENLPKPCENGGSLIHDKSRHAHICVCQNGYEGSHCEINTNICQEVENACSVHGDSVAFECQAVQGNGFVCYHPSRKSRWCRKDKTKNDSSPCPENWICLDHLLGEKQGYRCLPPGQLLPPKKRGKREVEKNCECQNGGRCDRSGTCVCLPHFTGLFCESFVNYCESDPCPPEVSCSPVLGGYNCECPEFRGGQNCESTRRRVIATMVGPRFYYHAHQYASIASTYILYVEELGILPRVVMDFGDGTPVVMHEKDFNTTKNVNEILIPLLFEPVDRDDTTVFLAVHTHVYQDEGIYNVSLSAWNKQFIAVEANFSARVTLPLDCDFQLEFKNSARTPDEATVYHAKDAIDVYSVSHVNCPGTRLKFLWELFAVPSLFTAHTPAMLKRPPSGVSTEESEYHMPAYSLTFGNYVLSLTAEMTEPIQGKSITTVTWFRVIKDKIVAHISGGTRRSAHNSELFKISASRSYDPNSHLVTMNFEWTCSAAKPKDVAPGFCDVDVKTVSIKPVLDIESHLLKIGGVYVFTVNVESVEHERSEQSVRIQIVPDYIELVQIECLENCLGNEVVHVKPMAVRAIYSNSLDKMSLQWKLAYRDDGTVPLSDEGGYKLEDDYFVVRANTLLPGKEYKIVVIIKNESNKDQRDGTAVLEFTTLSALTVGSCMVTPSQGYALLTLFHIRCFNFVTFNLPVVYEAFQYLYEEDLISTMIGFEVSPEFANASLAAGLPETHYLTELIVLATDNKGVIGVYRQNVTVFPAALYMDQDHEFATVKKMTLGTSTIVAMHLAEGDEQSVIQIALATSRSINMLSRSLLRNKIDFRHPKRSTDETELRDKLNTINQFRDTMVEYLSRCKLQSTSMIKYGSSALASVLETDYTDTSPNRTLILPRANRRAVDVLQAMLKTLETDNNAVRTRNDVMDIGPTVLSAIFSLMKEPRGGSENMQRRRRELRSRREDVHDIEVPSLDLADQERMLAKQMEAVMYNLQKYAELVSHYIVPHNDEYMMNPTGDLRLSMQKTSPGLKSANLPDVEINVTIPGSKNEVMYDLQVIALKDNPYWWKENSKDINFPVVTVDVFDILSVTRNETRNFENGTHNRLRRSTKAAVTGADFKFTAASNGSLQHETLEGEVAILPTWNYTNKDISVHKLEVRPGGKLILVFNDHKDNVLLRVVVKRNNRPMLDDFWEPDVIPRYHIKNATDLEKWSIHVEATTEGEGSIFYYLGIMPHQITLRTLLANIDPPIPDDFLYNEPPPKPDPSVGMKFIRYSFKAYNAQCLRWSESRRTWNTHCKVMGRDVTEASLHCRCKGLSTIGASFRSANHEKSSFPNLSLFIQFAENPLILCFVVYLAICFMGLFAWGGMWDRRDKKQDKIVMLDDNNDDDEYCYVLIVHTGRNADAATSSRVAVMLEGSEGNSSVHILHSLTRRVMVRGAKDCFVIRTPKSLGDVFCLHMWHNHKGARPTWYVSKVIVHDAQTDAISFFIIESWLTPLHGDGSMGISCFRMLDNEILPWTMRFKSAVAERFDAGHHCWSGMFTRQPPRNYMRRKCVVLAFTHTCVLMACVTQFYPKPVAGSPSDQMDSAGEFQYEWEEVIVGILAALMAFPVNCILFWTAKNVAPVQPYTTNYSSRFVEEVVVRMPSRGKMESPRVSDIRRVSIVQELQLNDLYKPGEKQVIGKRTVPLRLPQNQTDTIFYDEIISRTRPMRGRKVLRMAFVFPQGFIYPLWILLGVVLLVSLYFILYRATSYSWTTGLRYLIATWTGFLVSFVVLEPLKVLLLAGWLMLKRRGTYVFEDRSHIVVYIIRDLIPVLRPGKRTDSIYRPPTVYNPIPEDRLRDLQQNTTKRLCARLFQSETVTMIVFVICLALIQECLYDFGTYYHFRDVSKLIGGDHLYGETALTDVKYMEDFIGYIDTTYLSYLYSENDDKDMVRTMDASNYLVGSARMRQIRLHPDACTDPANDRLLSECEHRDIRFDSDNRNFSESWETLRTEPGTKEEEQPWLFKPIPMDVGESHLAGNESYYPTGGYTVLFGRDKKSAMAMYDYLKVNKWFDRYTRALVLDVSLFNPNIKVATTVRILGERCYNGGFTVHTEIGCATVRPMNVTEELKLFLTILVFSISLFLFSRRESIGFLFSPKKYLTIVWQLLSVLLTLGGILVLCLYAYRMKVMLNAVNRLRTPTTVEFISLHDVIWGQTLFLGAVTFTFAIAIMKFSSIVTARPKLYVLWYSVVGATKSLLAAAVLLLVLLTSFAWFGFLIYGSASLSYHSLDLALLALFRFAPNTADLVTLPTLNTWASVHSAILLITGIFICFYLIFHFLFYVIILNGYERTRLSMRKIDPKDIKDMYRHNVMVQRYFRDPKISTTDGMKNNLTPARHYAMHRILTDYVTQVFGTLGDTSATGAGQGEGGQGKGEDERRTSQARMQAMEALTVNAFANHRTQDLPPPDGDVTEADRYQQMATTLATNLRLRRVLERLQQVEYRFASIEKEEAREQRTRAKSIYEVPD